MSKEKQIEDQSEILYGGSRRGGRFFAELYEQAMRDAEAHPENYNDIFEGYENNLDKAVALIECQKQEIVSLTIINKAYGLAVKRLAAERSEQSEGEWIRIGQDSSRCSLCGEEHTGGMSIAYFCPNCGAKMKGGE